MKIHVNTTERMSISQVMPKTLVRKSMTSIARSTTYGIRIDHWHESMTTEMSSVTPDRRSVTPKINSVTSDWISILHITEVDYHWKVLHYIVL